MEPFWMVTGENNQPSKRHPTLRAAEEEAERLTRKERKIFVVMEARAICKPVVPQVAPIPVVWDSVRETADATSDR